MYHIMDNNKTTIKNVTEQAISQLYSKSQKLNHLKNQKLKKIKKINEKNKHKLKQYINTCILQIHLAVDIKYNAIKEQIEQLIDRYEQKMIQNQFVDIDGMQQKISKMLKCFEQFKLVISEQIITDPLVYSQTSLKPKKYLKCILDGQMQQQYLHNISRLNSLAFQIIHYTIFQTKMIQSLQYYENKELYSIGYKLNDIHVDDHDVEAEPQPVKKEEQYDIFKQIKEQKQYKQSKMKLFSKRKAITDNNMNNIDHIRQLAKQKQKMLKQLLE